MTADLEAKLPLGVEAEGVRPPSGQHACLHTPIVRAIEQPHLCQTRVAEDVAIVLAVHDGDPGLELHFHVAIEEEGAAERDFVPTARRGAVLAVRLMLQHEEGVTDVLVVVDDEVAQAYAGIEVQISHRERLL